MCVRTELYRLLHSIRILALTAVFAIVISFIIMEQCAPSGTALVKYVSVLDNRKYLGLFNAFIAAFFFCGDFERRSFNGALYAGYSRLNIFLSKLLCYVILSYLISVVSVYAPLLRCARGFTDITAGERARCAALRALLDLNLMGVPVLAAGIFRKTIPCLAVGAGYGFAVMFLAPSHVELWLWTADKPQLLAALLPPPFSFAVLVALGCLVFTRAELK